MQHEIELISDKYDQEILMPIWKDALPDLDNRRIKWSYEENPDGKADLFLLKVSAEQKYVGVCAVLPRNYYYGGKEVKGGITVDFSVKKEYRSLGPAVMLQKAIAASKKYDILVAFPNKSAVNVQIRAGYKVMGHLTRFIKVFRSAPVLKRRYRPFIAALAAPFADIFLKMRSIRFRKNLLDNHQINNVLDERAGKLWQEAKSQFDFAGNRNFQYLYWRFLKNPYKTYQVFTVEEQSTKQLTGYLIYYIENNIAYVYDFLSKNLETYVEQLFVSFFSYCKRMKVDAVSLEMIENSNLANFFSKSGFIKEQTTSKVLYFQEGESDIKAENIFITSGDCDF